MADRIPIERIAIGDSVKDGVYRLKAVRKDPSGGYSFTVSDKTGEMRGLISPERWVESYKDLVDGAVAINAVVYVGNDGEPLLKLRSMALAPGGTYRPSDLFDGLSEEKIKSYTDEIKKAINTIPNPSLKALATAVLSKKTLSSLAGQPATLAYYGRYMGGALAATAAVTKIAMQMGAAYNRQENGLYHLPLDWSVLITASVVHMAAIPEFYTETAPFRMTEEGVQRGYMSLLQDKIEKTIQTYKVRLSTSELSKLLNVLVSAVPKKTGICSTSPEGKMLRAAINFYSEMDQLSRTLSESDFDEVDTYTYLNRIGFVVTGQGEEPADRIGGVAA